MGSVNAACTNFRPPPAPVPPAQAGAAPAEAWQRDVGRGLFPPIARDDTTLYLAGTDRRVSAVLLANGKRRWQTRLGGPILGGSIRSGRRLFAATTQPEGKVHAFWTETGREIWDRTVGSTGVPLAMIHDQLIAFTEAGIIVALDPADGRVRWRRRLGPGRAPAVAAGDAILVSTVDSLYRLSSDSGKVLTRRSSPGAVLGDWVPAAGLLVAGTTRAELVALRPDDLTEAWRVPLDGPVFTRPALTGDSLYVVTRIGTLYRVRIGPDRPEPQVVARLTWPVTAPPALAHGLVLLGGADGILRALTPDGREVWRVALWQPIEIPPLPLADGFVALGGNGDLHRFQ